MRVLEDDLELLPRLAQRLGIGGCEIDALEHHFTRRGGLKGHDDLGEG